VKVVVAALPAFGHVYPLVPLAMAWQRAGHEVLMAVGDGLRADLPGRRIPGAEPAWTLADAIVRAQQMVGQHAGMPPPEEMPTVLFLQECAPHVVEVMREQLHREQPDVVVFEQSNLGAAIAAREAGCPGVAVGIVGWSSRWGRAYTAAAATIGALAQELASTFVDTHPAFLADASATPPPFPVTAMRPTAWAPDGGSVPPWLLEPHRAPRAYLTLGTIFGREDLLAAAAHEVAEAGCEVLLATGPGVDPSQLSGLPPSVHVEQLVPQARVLPHVDVVVHHAGTGTVIGSLEHGLPQVLIPRGADQFWNAEHLATQGAARAVLPDAGPGSVSEAVSDLLSPDAPERREARRLGASVAAMPSPEKVAAAIADATERRTPLPP
jgi:UDP:flavonoid glycosyltransferase YjiC (YdhE family)